MNIRPATRADLARLTDIYNHYVLNDHATFDIEPFTVETRLAWFEHFDGRRYQCWIAEEGTGPLGYACSIPFRAKAAYQTSVEVSVYVAVESLGRQIGRTLYETLLPALQQQDLHRAYAMISQPNEPSMRLHESFGFLPVARLTEVGRKFDRYWDVSWLELAFQ